MRGIALLTMALPPLLLVTGPAAAHPGLGYEAAVATAPSPPLRLARDDQRPGRMSGPIDIEKVGGPEDHEDEPQVRGLRPNKPANVPSANAPAAQLPAGTPGANSGGVAPGTGVKPSESPPSTTPAR